MRRAMDIASRLIWIFVISVISSALFLGCEPDDGPGFGVLGPGSEELTTLYKPEVGYFWVKCGPVEGYTSVIMYGCELESVTKVTIDGSECTGLAADMHQVSFVTPAHAAGLYNFEVTFTQLEVDGKKTSGDYPEEADLEVIRKEILEKYKEAEADEFEYKYGDTVYEITIKEVEEKFTVDCDQFEYIEEKRPCVSGPPASLGTDPPTGQCGTITTIQGAGFNELITVQFGRTRLIPPEVTYISESQITCVVPPGKPSSRVDVIVINGFGDCEIKCSGEHIDPACQCAEFVYDDSKCVVSVEDDIPFDEEYPGFIGKLPGAVLLETGNVIDDGFDTHVDLVAVYTDEKALVCTRATLREGSCPLISSGWRTRRPRSPFATSTAISSRTPR